MSDVDDSERAVPRAVGARIGHSQDFEPLVVSARNLRRALRAMNMEHATHATVARELFNGRASARIIKAWRLGTRHMPPWAIDRLKEKGAAISDAANQIPRGPGQPAGWRNIPGYMANQGKR